MGFSTLVTANEPRGCIEQKLIISKLCTLVWYILL